MNGLLVINKPLNFTSMDIIRIVRKLTGIRKVGHAGTLDPLATGVLLVCVGNATKKIESLMNTGKKYSAEINLTAFSTTDDNEGELNYINVEKIPSINEVEKQLKGFIGETYQTPPKYSALKIGGLPAYKRARLGEEVKIESRKIFIESIELISYKWPFLNITVCCHKGTYIRSLARDIGTKLSTGGFLTGLIRTGVGKYQIDEALDLSNFTKIEQENLIQL